MSVQELKLHSLPEVRYFHYSKFSFFLSMDVNRKNNQLEVPVSTYQGLFKKLLNTLDFQVAQTICADAE